MFPLCRCGYQLVEHHGPWRPQDIAPEGEHTEEEKGCGYWHMVWECGNGFVREGEEEGEGEGKTLEVGRG